MSRPGVPEGEQFEPLAPVNLRPDLTQEELDRLIADFRD